MKKLPSTIILILGWLTSTGMTAPSVENIEELSAPKSVMLPSDEGPVEAVMRERSFVFREDAKLAWKETARLVVVPSKRVYWLGLSGGKFVDGTLNQRKFFVLGGRIVGILTGRGGSLSFAISSDSFAAGNEEKTIQSAFEKRLAEIGTKNTFDIFETPIIYVNAEHVLGPSPFTHEGDARGEPAAKITNITVNKNSFALTLEGGVGHYKVVAVIMFDDHFKPISASLYGQQVYPKPKNP